MDKVILKIKGVGRTRSFLIKQAKELLSLNNSQWELSDENYTLENGDLQKKPKVKEKEKSENDLHKNKDKGTTRK